jgi:hypothetical protein
VRADRRAVAVDRDEAVEVVRHAGRRGPFDGRHRHDAVGGDALAARRQARFARPDRVDVAVAVEADRERGQQLADVPAGAAAEQRERCEANAAITSSGG